MSQLTYIYISHFPLHSDAQTDIEELLTTSQKKTKEGYLDAAKAAHGISRSADRSRQQSVLLKINYDDCKSLFEFREYQVMLIVIFPSRLPH